MKLPWQYIHILRIPITTQNDNNCVLNTTDIVLMLRARTAAMLLLLMVGIYNYEGRMSSFGKIFVAIFVKLSCWPKSC
jgi:hypothetical protein